MFLMVIVSFLRFAMQKYSISQNENQLVKPFRGLVYHVAKIQKIKRLDFKLLQNRNPIVVYVVVYVIAFVETQNFAVLQLVFQPRIGCAVSLLRAVGLVFVFRNEETSLKQRRENITAETRPALVADFFHHLQNALRNTAKLQDHASVFFFTFTQCRAL